MSSVIRRLAIGGCAAGFRLLPASTARGAAGVDLLAPLYHLIADQRPAHVKHLFAVRNTRTFSDDLDFFLRTSTPITLEQLHAHRCHGMPLPPKAMFLSFDDGMREVADVIAPILSRRGVPATFFLNSGFVDNKTLFYRHKASLLCEKVEQVSTSQLASLREALLANGADVTDPARLKKSILSVCYAERTRLDVLAKIMGVDFDDFLQKHQPYMNSDQIRQLLRAGFSIGAHSVDHPRYAEIELDEQLRQTRESISFLKERFGVTTRDLAFPFVSDGVGANFYKAAYEGNEVDMLFCLGGIATNNPRNVERFWMENDATTPAATIVNKICFDRWRAGGRNGDGRQ